MQISVRDFDPVSARRLTAAGVHPVLARVYAARGVNEAEQLESGLSRLLHFGALKNIQAMSVRLADAIMAQARILIVADYDADGATACAVAVRGFALLGLQVGYLVPNRFEYGYGLTPEIVRLAATHQPEIIVTVDNGIASIAGVETAKTLGIEVLITDHHLAGDSLPDALIVNPNQPGCIFPSKHLAGVGVMFYVLLAVRAELLARGVFAPTATPNLAQLLDIVALGTVADVVRLDENNRILVEQGLRRMRQGRACAGIGALFQVSNRAIETANAADLGFMIGPRLNAAGRLQDMSLGIACLLSADDLMAANLAQRLHALNIERREIEADMQEQALAHLEQIAPGDSYSLVMFDPDWHQGVIGILASRLKDKFHRPVICFARSTDGEIKGSGRSIGTLHLRDALDWVAKRAPNLILKFGGHAAAAGLSIHEAQLAEFTELFEASVRHFLTPDDLASQIHTDGSLADEDFTPNLAQAIATQVWGQGFPAPDFEGVFRVTRQRVLKDKHLKLQLAAGKASFDSILFNRTDRLPDMIRAVFQLELHTYQGSTSLQIKLHHWSADREI
ncbi:MAG: single-stranded-DNA-specific exonuclease RecJ [Sulfuriferula sp.]